MLLFLLQAISPQNLNDQTMNTASWVATTATVVIALATVAYLITTIGLWRTTRDNIDITRRMFEESNRPRVGAIQAVRKADVYAGIKEGADPGESSPREIRFAVTYVNSGSTFAHKVTTSVDVFVDGKKCPPDVLEEAVSEMLLPNYPYECVRLIKEESWVKAIDNAGTLSVVFKCSYWGASGQQTEPYSCDQKYAYDKADKAFYAVRGAAT